MYMSPLSSRDACTLTAQAERPRDGSRDPAAHGSMLRYHGACVCRRHLPSTNIVEPMIDLRLSHAEWCGEQHGGSHCRSFAFASARSLFRQRALTWAKLIIAWTSS